MNLEIDSDRLSREIEALSAISEAPPPVVTRVVFSEADWRARDFIRQLTTEAGLSLRCDAVGNTFARWEGQQTNLAPVATGSHIDAIPNAGRFDGTVGVLGGLEAIRSLKRARFKPRRAIELIVFTAEEPTRFGIGCLGSRLIAGVLSESAGVSLRDRDGRTLDTIRNTAGFSGPLNSVRLFSGAYAGFVELHIEQGPILEQTNVDIGVVTAIAAPAALDIIIEGEGGHAGAVLMPQRRDAFLAAAEIALAVEAAALSTGAADTVGTVGICDVFPGAVNSIPSRAHLTVDVRDIDGARRDSVLRFLDLTIPEIEKRRSVAIHTQVLNADDPVECDPRMVHAIARACATHGIRFERVISRAYHDSLFMARVAPTAMIFIPCRGGVSHRPDEFASPEAMARGSLVLAETLANLASE